MQTEQQTNDTIDVEGDREIVVEIDRVPDRVGWQQVDAALRGLANRRAVLDAAEARWLRAAVRVKLWRELGCVSLLDYLERRLGYAPRTAHDRVRVAVALGELPLLEHALEQGLPHSAVRELTRVATRDTEQAWLDACRGKSVHEIEQRVSGRARGALPGDAAQPDLTTRTIPFEEVRPSTVAMLRAARTKAQHERGHHLTDDDLLALLCGVFLEGSSAEPDRARHQIAVTICEQCGAGWQEGGGRQHAMDRAEVERALCDSQHIGSLDDEPGRATQDIPPRVRRHVYRRDGGKCSLPGCRSAANLELHHIVPRATGGTHDPRNVVQLCDGCHAAHHRGLIAISGTAPDNLVVERQYPVTYDGLQSEPICAHVGTNAAQSAAVPQNDALHAALKHGAPKPSPRSTAIAPHHEQATFHIESSRFDREALRADARTALVTLGFRRADAAISVDRAISMLGPEATLESVIREALRANATPKAHHPKKIPPSKKT